MLANDRKLKSEMLLRKLLNSMNASSSSRPEFDVVNFPSDFIDVFIVFSVYGAIPMLHGRFTPSQGVSSLSLNGGSVNLTFTPKTTLKERQTVVFEDSSGAIGSYSLPYLFQSVDTVNVGSPNHKLSLCDAELSNALKYTDKFGHLGSHPNYPPFPLCRSKLSSATTPVEKISSSNFNSASATEGFPILFEDSSEIDPYPDFYGEPATWLTEDWTASIIVPDTLVKTVSSGTL